MTREHAQFVVVGVDGTPEADAALAVALDEAIRTGDAVLVITAWHPQVPAVTYPVLPATPMDRETPRRRAESIQQQALERVGVPASVPVSTQVPEGVPGSVLVRAARTARLLVVGSRGFGPVRAALFGSVSRYCVRHATCPVLVVPALTHPPCRHQDAALVPAQRFGMS
jgi:nucleotide-binding universal stress UspA family protein